MVPILLAAVLALMKFHISTFRSLCAVPNMAVICISLTSLFPSMVLTYFLNGFETVSVAQIIAGVILLVMFIVTLLLFRFTALNFLPINPPLNSQLAYPCDVTQHNIPSDLLPFPYRLPITLPPVTITISKFIVTPRYI
jgi:hypothetical protein